MIYHAPTPHPQFDPIYFYQDSQAGVNISRALGGANVGIPDGEDRPVTTTTSTKIKIRIMVRVSDSDKNKISGD